MNNPHDHAELKLVSVHETKVLRVKMERRGCFQKKVDSRKRGAVWENGMAFARHRLPVLTPVVI